MGRLLEILRDEFGLVADGIEPLVGGRVNRLFRCGDWVMKVYDHRQVPRARAEMAVQLQARAATMGLPVPHPLLTRRGSLWASYGNGLVIVMPLVKGHRYARGSLNGASAASLGAVLGGLHEMLRDVPSPAPSPPLPTTIANRWEEIRRHALSTKTPTDFDRLVIEVADYVSTSLPRVPSVDWRTQPWQFCHGDLHLDNMLFDDQGLVVGILDFDNAAPSWVGAELMDPN